ncbi:tetratricopeptide repeat protein [Mucilaginibacter sp. dw_454]|uniref:tetratricopeptide repeat protein n=1 Tax=Mucilaginibacter sp. dw_454 TaxID=2720079 RepID=UPI001BD69E76|nr:tetratricopeptide repeat protein [Mucilaginibacter sp. dw_454]
MGPLLKQVLPLALSRFFGLIIFLFFFIPDSYALTDILPINNFNTHPFDTIGHITPEQRVYIATDIYKRNLRHVPETVAMARLNELTNIARQLDDKALESVVFDLKADYYAVNLRFNPHSVNLYKQAIDFATENKLPLYAAIYLQHEGMFFYNLKHNTTACYYFLKAQEAFRAVGFEKAPNMSAYFSQVAEFYYHLGDYPNAEIQLQNALKYPIKHARDRIGMINTLGLIRRSGKQYRQALEYFQRVLDLAKTSKDTVWVGIATGNIGSIYFNLGEYDKAAPFIQTDYEQSLKYGEKNNATIALLRLVKINLLKNNVTRCLKQLDTAELLIKNSATSVLNIKTDIYDLKAQCYDKLGQPAAALVFRRKYELTKDSLAVQNNIAAVEVVKMQYVVGKQQAEDNRLKAQARERDGVFVILFLLIVILLLLFSRQALKARNDKELLQSEKRRLDEELKYTDMKLQTYTEHIRKNNKLIDRFREQIDQLKNKNADSSVVEHLEKLMQAHIMTDANWQEFKKIFVKVYPDYLFNVKKNFMSLSETDVRLLTLIKLQCTNKEMANMLGITAEGIKKAKQRLRKKMKLNNNISIEEAISIL